MAIAFVNAAANFVAGSGSSIAAPATSLTAGNLIVVAVRLGVTAISDVTGVTDTAGNTYRVIASTNSTAASIDLWYAPNTLGNASNVVTAAFSTSVAATSIVTVQFSGLDTGTPLDTSSVATATSSATVTCAAITTIVANEVLVMGAQIEATGTTWTAGTGYTIAAAAQDASHVTVIEYQIVSSLQSSVTPTISSSNSSASKCGVCAAFNASTGGGAVTMGYGFA